MKKINTDEIEEESWKSPEGKFGAFGKSISIALGRDPQSTDLMKRHPFDVEILRIPPGKSPYPFHSHSAQWEFYHVISGTGSVRHEDGRTAIESGDAFVFKPNEPHEIINDSEADLVLYVIADNPIGETWHYPDSGKWGVQIPEKQYGQIKEMNYYDGEE